MTLPPPRHPESLEGRPYTVYGCWETGERFGTFLQAPSPRAAEDMAQMGAREAGGALYVCRVVAGHVTAIDRYTNFVDPGDPRNQYAGDLIPDTPDFAAGDPEYTVLGFAAPEGAVDLPVAAIDPRAACGWERYGDVVNATSPGAAEDVARDRLNDRGGQFLVCAVLPGEVRAVDTYALFADPDMKAG